MEVKKFKDLVEEEVSDNIVKMNDPFLEVSVPEGEPDIYQALRYGDLDMVQRQIRQGFQVNSKFTDGPYKVKNVNMEHRIQTTHYSALHLAVLHCTQQIIDELLTKGTDINILDEQKRTPLHFAVVVKRFAVLNNLILKGADINCQSISGRTPLLEAVINNDFTTARILIEAGADINVSDIKGSCVLHQLCFRHQLQVNIDFLQYVLSKNCAINQTNSKGSTALMFAATMRNLPVCKLLVEHGANINQRDSQGMSALQFVLEHKIRRPEVLLYLIQHGANIDIVNKKGMPVLEMAMKYQSVTIFVCLLLADIPRNATQIKEHEQIIYLCERLPDFKTWLDEELASPRSLSRCCRSVIREHLSPDRLAMVDQLDIPRYLQNFLLCKDITPERLNVTGT